MVLDVRFLPNPYFVEALSASTGEEAAVREFVLDNADAREFLEQVAGAARVPACRARNAKARHT